MTMPTSLGTAAAAAMNIFALSVSPVPTVSQIPLTLMEQHVRPAQRGTYYYSSVASFTPLTEQSTSIVANDERYEESARLTTPHENVIGEIRQWGLLGIDWDGEGAAAPDVRSTKEAEAFIRLIDGGIPLPEPMLLASGHAALYWNDGKLYADIEFLGDERIAYFIKNNGDKHKGVLTFNSQKMPAVLQTLLTA